VGGTSLWNEGIVRLCMCACVYVVCVCVCLCVCMCVCVCVCEREREREREIITRFEKLPHEMILTFLSSTI
jgi:hypothetical protein